MIATTRLYHVEARDQDGLWGEVAVWAPCLEEARLLAREQLEDMAAKGQAGSLCLDTLTLSVRA